MRRTNFYLILISLLLLSTSSFSSIDDQNGSIPNPIEALFNGFQQQESDPLLEPDQAFNLTAKLNPDSSIMLNWQIAEGYYLYQHKIKVNVLTQNNLSLNPLTFPPGKQKHDEIFGDTVVYYHQLNLQQTVSPLPKTATELRIKVDFQGCADIGVCYPPMNKVISLAVPPANASAALRSNTAISEQDKIAQSLINNTLLLTCLTFLGFGILLSFTPCVFPMIPILSGIIIGHGKHITSKNALYLSLSYVLASALTYAVFGILAGLFGDNLQATFQNPWILSIFSLIFVALSLSMFGLYQLQLPTVIQSKLSQLSQHQKHGSLWGSAIMGCLSTLIVGPCVAAPLAGVLIYIGQTGDAILGGFALFSLGLGMGIPLIIIGVSAGKLLPKAGLWMEPIKYFFGVLLLAVAIWLMERVLPAEINLALWAILLIICAIYLKALDRLADKASGWQKLAKGLGVVLLIYGLILMVGATSGATNPLKPLENLSINRQASTQHHGLPFKPIKNLQQLNAALAHAAENKQRVMLDFYADWCISCKEMDRYTFSDPKVQNALKDTVLLQADVTKNDDQDKALLKAFALIGPPAILFFQTDSVELSRHRVVGYMPSDLFLQQLRKINP